MNTYGDIRNTFYQMFRDSPTDQVFITTTQADNFANKGLRDMAQAAWYKDAEVDIASSATEFSLGEHIRCWRGEGTVAGTLQYMKPISKESLIQSFRRFETVTGVPRHWFLDYNRVDENVRVGIYPDPGTLTAYKFYCYTWPTPVTSAATSFELDMPDWAVAGLMYYMLWQAYLSDTKRQDLDLAAFYRDLYYEVRDLLIGASKGRMPSYPDRHKQLNLGASLRARSPEIITGTP